MAKLKLKPQAKDILILDIIKLMNEERAKLENAEASLVSFANKLGNAIDKYYNGSAGGNDVEAPISRTITDGNILNSILESVKNALNEFNETLINHTHTFESLTDKPTTIDGYGITDARSEYVSEKLTNEVDGINKLFVTTSPFDTDTLVIYLNGIKENHYIILSDTEIEFEDAPLNNGFTDVIEATYRKKLNPIII